VRRADDGTVQTVRYYDHNADAMIDPAPGSYTIGACTEQDRDFWRSAPGGAALPDGVADDTEAIRRSGAVGINTDPLTQFDLGGDVAVRLAPVQVTAGGTLNNLALPAGYSSHSLAGVTAQTVTGIAGATPGKLLMLHNDGVNPVTLANNDPASAAANQITTGTGGPLPIQPGGMAALQYDSFAAKWHVISGGGATVSAENVIDVTGVSTPQPSPSAFSGATFTPSQPADPDVIYALPDNTTWRWNGTQYTVFIAPPSTEWYLGGTTNDAGATKTTAIERPGLVGFGTTTGPHSSVDIKGSFSTRPMIASLPGGTTVLGAADHTLEVTSGAPTHNVTLPAAATVPGREYRVALAAGNLGSLITVTSAGGQVGDQLGALTSSVQMTHPQLRSATWKSDGVNWLMVSGFSATVTGQSSVIPQVYARATVDIGDPTAVGARPISSAFNVASATGLDGPGTDSRFSVAFSQPLATANYYIVGHFTSKTPAGWSDDNDLIWTVSSKTTTGFQIAVREVAVVGVAQAVDFDFMVLAMTSAGGALPGSEVSALVPLDTPVTIDNIRMEARLTGGQGFRVATVSGTLTYNISAICSYAADAVFASNRPGLTMTTTMTHPFLWAGQSDADHVTGMIFDRTNNRVYEFMVMTNVAPTPSFIRIRRVYG
jgi:hypothetical protein